MSVCVSVCRTVQCAFTGLQYVSVQGVAVRIMDYKCTLLKIFLSVLQKM